MADENKQSRKERVEVAKKSLQIAAWWMDKVKDRCKNQLLKYEPEPEDLEDALEDLNEQIRSWQKAQKVVERVCAERFGFKTASARYESSDEEVEEEFEDDLDLECAFKTHCDMRDLKVKMMKAIKEAHKRESPKANVSGRKRGRGDEQDYM